MFKEAIQLCIQKKRQGVRDRSERKVHGQELRSGDIMGSPEREISEPAWTLGSVRRDLNGRGSGAGAVTPGFYMRCLG